MKSAFKSFQIFLLLCGVFGADADEVKSVSVMEGDSVTLNPDLTQIKKFNLIEWRFGDPVIAQTDGNDITYPSHTEIFRDRLQLDQTGSLTIKNMRTEHSGLYKLQIHHSTGTSHMKFNVTIYESVSDAGVAEMKLMSLKEGDPVILQTDVPQLTGDELIVWRFGDEGKLIAKGDIEAKSSPLYYEERFRDRLQLNDQTGSLTITNTRTTDSGFYTAKISSNKQTLNKRFIVTVSAVPDSGLSPGAVAGIVVTVLLVAVVAAAAGVIYSRRKISELQKQAYPIKPEPVKVEEGGFAFLPSGVTEIKEGDQMLWMFKDEESPIATMSKKDKKTYFYDNEKFRGRLQLDPQTGSLIIRNFRKTDSGLYQLQIKSKEGTAPYKKYQVALCGEVTTMPVKERDKVTLKIDFQLERGADMKWWFRNKMCIASLIKEEEQMKCSHVAGGRFKDRLELDKTGSLTIKNIRPEHTGLYEVKTKSSSRKFSVISDVSSLTDSTKTLIRESVGQIQKHLGLAGRGSVIIETDEMKTVSVKEGETLKLSTDTKIQEDDEMLLMFGSKAHPYKIIARFSEQDKDEFITVSKRLTDRLKLVHNGFITITITSINITDCGDYYVQITNKRNESFKSFTFTVVPDGVFSGEVQSVSVIKGKSVILNPDPTQIQKADLIVWTFGHEGRLLVKSDVKYEIEKSRLELDHQTGSLTITNIRTTDSGLYELQTIRNTQFQFWRFIVTVLDEEEMEPVEEGESVTLTIDESEIQPDDLILWKFKDMILAKNKEICSKHDGLELDHKTGSLTIKNITITNCGYYTLQIINRERAKNKRFKVSIKASLTDASGNIVDVDTFMYDDGVDDRYENLRPIINV